MSTARTTLSLVLLITACGAPAKPPTPTNRERASSSVELEAYSTVGWGCHAPPFRRIECGPDEQDGENPRDCFFLTATPAGTPSDVAILNGVYALEGHWTKSMTYSAWRASQGNATEQCGAMKEEPLPVLEVATYCLTADDAARQEDNLKDLTEAGETRAWLAAHRCH